MSLKQFLVQQDRINYGIRNGNFDLPMPGTQTKKRKLDEVGIDVDSDVNGGNKRRKLNNDGFLDCGSVSWSLLLAIFFLSLHKG